MLALFDIYINSILTYGFSSTHYVEKVNNYFVDQYYRQKRGI